MERQTRTVSVPLEGGRGGVGGVRWRLGGLLLLAFGLTLGCNPLTNLAFLLAPDSQEQPKCVLTIPGKESTVVIFSTFGGPLPSNPMLIDTDWQLSYRLTQLLDELYKANKDRVKIVRPTQVKGYMNSHPKWRDQTPQDLGKHFAADFVINLEINNISLYDQKSANFFYHGNVDISVTVVDVSKPVGEGLIWEDVYQIEYPKGPLEISEMSPGKFRQKFMDHIARELSQYFAAHEPREKYNAD